MVRNIAKIMTLTIGLPSMAMAGDVLHLKSGSLNTKQKSHEVLRSVQATKTSYYVVQYKSAISQADQKQLSDLKVEVVRYIPDDAYVVKAKRSVLAKLKRSPSISVVLPYAEQFKLDPADQSLSVFSSNKTKQMQVRAFNGADMASVVSALHSIEGVEVLDRGKRNLRIELPFSSLAQVIQVDGIEWVEEYTEKKIQKLAVKDLFDDPEIFDGDVDIPIRSLEELTGYESGTKIMNFESAWDRGYKGKGQLITVADTGLDTGEAETLNPDFYGLVKPYVGGWKSESWGDPDSHGTHVSGSAVGKGTSSGGLITGGATEAELVIESFYSPVAGGLTVPPNFEVIFEYAYKDGSRIHTNSWGDPTNPGAYNEDAEVVDRFMWENPDMLILFAAGNDGNDLDGDGRVDPGSLATPATAKNALTVGASENFVSVGGIQMQLGFAGSPETGFRWPAEPIASDTFSNNPDGLSAFSSRGPTTDGRIKPDVVAPGTNVLSTCSQYSGAGSLWGTFNKEYCYSGGTSMSTPLVAGAAAVVRQFLIEKKGVETPSAALMKAVLMHNTDDLYPGQYGEVGKENGQELLKPGANSNQGYGRVNVDRATQSRFQVVDEKAGIAVGEVKSYPVPLGVKKVTLVYTDAPGSPAASKALVNNLDLEVHVKDRFFASNSELNNVEQVSLTNVTGRMEIRVKGTNVPMGHDGKQPFALVYQ